MRMPKLAIAVSLFVLAAFAGAMTYTGYLLVGVLADTLGTSRFVAGLLLGGLFARLPRIRDGKLRTVGLLPKRARQPVMAGLLAFGLVSFLYRGDTVPVLFFGCAAAFFLTYPSIKRAVLGRIFSSLFQAPGEANRRETADDDDTVIDVEFREKKD